MSKSEHEKSYNESEIKQLIKEQKIKEQIEAASNFFAEMKLTPFAFANLHMYLALDAWYWQDALLLLAGGKPEGADIDWNGYHNFCDVLINSPKVNNVSFIDCRLPEYDVPEDYSYSNDESFFKGDGDVEEKITELGKFQKKLEGLYTFWTNALEPRKERYSPNYYIEWALSKGIDIPWLDFAIEQGFYKPKQLQEVESKPLADKERETLVKIIHALAKNGYKYPTHGAVKEIVNDFELHDNGVSEKTLVKYLKEFNEL